MRNEYESRYENEMQEERVERPRSSSRRRTSDDTEKKKRVKIINTKLLNVRSTPEDEGTKNIIGQLKAGETVEVVKREGDYYKIPYKKGHAYIHSKFCEEV